MESSVLNSQEVHAFAIDTILPYIEKEGVEIDSVNRELHTNPQIIGKRWGSLAFIYVRVSLYPVDKGELSESEFTACLNWAKGKGASAFFAGVGLICANYPDKTAITNKAEWSIPLRNGGFAVNYEHLLLMGDSTNVKLWPSNFSQ